MQAIFHTIRYPHGTYLVIEDNEGADASLLMLDGELPSQCLERHIRDEQYKRDLHARRASRMQSWSDQIIVGQSA